MPMSDLNKLLPAPGGTLESSAAHARPSILQRIRFCSHIQWEAHTLLIIAQRMAALIKQDETKIGLDYETCQADLNNTLEDLENLLNQAEITTFMLLNHFYTLDKWKKKVTDGMILDVFSQSGLDGLNARIRKAITLLNGIADQIIDYLDTNQKGQSAVHSTT